MDFRLLGPLEAGDGREPLPLGPRKQRALLARLLLDAGRTVSVEQLLDDLWGEDLPDSAPKMVQMYVSGLRKVLGTGRLLTAAPGYRFELEPGDDLDFRRFEELAAAGHAALANGDPATASARLEDALGLWRGRALAEFASEPFGRAEGDRLEAMRLAADEERIEASLALGRAADLVAELEALVARHPLRERPREQLMLALHRSGRPAEALAGYHAFRGLLDEELGLEPSPRLRKLEQAIVTHDSSLDVGRPGPALATLWAAPPGRAAEFEVLRDALTEADAGRRRLVLVRGEPGIGKSTLVDALVASAGDALVVSGDCVEQEGAGEAYLPLLDGLARLAAERSVAATLASHAPSWLPHIPGAADASGEPTVGFTRERMLREMVQALEALAADRVVVLVIEDLQWVDPSTRDLLRALMRRRHPARILVLATGSAPDALVADLSLRAAAQELALGPLDAEAAATAFALDAATATELAHRGGGNPLFMRHLVEHLRATGTLDGMPGTLGAALRARLAELDERQVEVLQAGAVEGMQFTASGVSAALGRPVGAIPAFPVVEPRGTVRWPDGTETATFGFLHSLCRDVVLATIPPHRREELHRRVGERLEAAFGVAPEAAQAIARHYLAGGHPAAAVRFLRLAADLCASRRAYRETIGHLREALEASEELPAGAPRLRARTEVLSQLGQAHVAVDGWSSSEALGYLERARATAEELDDQEPLAAVLLALATLYEVRGQPGPALDAIAAGRRDAVPGVEGAELLACGLFHQGAFTRALEQADRGAAAFELGETEGHYTTFPATFGDNAGVACHDWAALSLWFLGRAGESMRRALHALELSESPERAYSAATARAQLAVLHACRDEPDAALTWAQATVDAARDRGYAYRVAMGRVLRGWARAAQGHRDGVDEIACGLSASRATGAQLEEPFYLALLADAHLRNGSVGAGLAAVGEALGIAARERAHYYDAELHRLRGELMLTAGGDADEATASIREALRIAREQGARSVELRAALSLVRALPDGRSAADARAALAIAHEALADEDMPDVRAAAALIDRAPPAPPTTFERRRAAVLAWRIDRVSDLAETLEPDRLGAVVSACHAAARAAVIAEGGQVATQDGAGGIVFFVDPQGDEDAPVRAVRAALALVGASGAAVGGVPVQLAGGVDTGQAVVGRLGRSSLALGQAPRTASRLAAGAAPGTVVVSDATRAACRGSLDFAEAPGGHRVTGSIRAGATAEGQPPPIARPDGLALLEDRWEQAMKGLGQAVLLSGEDGTGRSWLVRELATRLGLDGDALLTFRCSTAHTDVPLHAVAETMGRRLSALAAVPPETLTRRASDLVVSHVLDEASRHPVLVVVEEAHRADPASLEVFGDLLASIDDARVLFVATFRPSWPAPWEVSSHVSHLSLGSSTRSDPEDSATGVASSTS